MKKSFSVTREKIRVPKEKTDRLTKERFRKLEQGKGRREELCAGETHLQKNEKGILLRRRRNDLRIFIQEGQRMEW